MHRLFWRISSLVRTRATRFAFLSGRAWLVGIRTEDTACSSFSYMGHGTRLTGVGQLAIRGGHHGLLLVLTGRVGAG